MMTPMTCPAATAPEPSIAGPRIANLVAGAMLAAASLAPAPAASATPEEVLSDAVSAYTALTPITRPGGLDLEQAHRVQRVLVLVLRPQWGEIVGYKAALTSAAAQRRFGLKRPVTGVLLENMFTSTGATIALDTGIRLILEADLLVRVADEAINDAAGPEEIVAALDEVIPFLETPDLMYAEGVELRGADVVSINAGARLGVMGAPLKVASMRDPVARLGAFTFEMEDGKGEVVARGGGEALMGHPLNAVLWLKNDLNRRGMRLKSGDLLSLGAMHRPLPAHRFERVKLTYHGLSDAPAVIHVGIRRKMVRSW